MVIKTMECAIICQKSCPNLNHVADAAAKMLAAITGHIPKVTDCNPFWEDPKLIILNETQQKSLNKERSLDLMSSLSPRGKTPNKKTTKRGSAMEKPIHDFRKLSLGYKLGVTLAKEAEIYCTLEKLREFYHKDVLESRETPKRKTRTAQLLQRFKKVTSPLIPDTVNPIRRIRDDDNLEEFCTITSYDLGNLVKMPDIDHYYPVFKELVSGQKQISDLIVTVKMGMDIGQVDSKLRPYMYEHALRYVLHPGASRLEK
jgi:hypothetical protein